MLSLTERCANYARVFPAWPAPFVGKDGRIQGVWLLGQNYRSTQSYYGEYPPNYLKRVFALFPDIQNPQQILHLFSGVVSEQGITFDIDLCSQLHPDITGDAHALSSYFKLNSIMLILADPPYSKEDANHYGTPMINRNKVVKECYKILKPTGFLCWLDQVFPMYRKDQFDLIGVIGVIRSTNHRVRCLFIFQKLAEAYSSN